ncbi:MAG TPA: hypothetical protein VNB91_11150 [Jatrophihabitantaceae bacterium]|nr:hypothetical protein [Jatrophihabitantaceae bacterium]
MFGWWPEAWTIRLGTDGQYSDGSLLITAVLLLLAVLPRIPVAADAATANIGFIGFFVFMLTMGIALLRRPKIDELNPASA